MSVFKRVAIAAGLFSVLVLQISTVMPYPTPPAAKNLIRTERFFDLTILGRPMATKEQCISYLLRRNPLPLISVSPSQLVDLYYQEALLEGIRPDLAFAQALHETGNFAYGGDVVPLQNNYCGLGTTGGGVKGAWFPTAQIGVRAQIQHLLAYSTKRSPLLPIVDPRYELVKKTSNFGQSLTWTDLNGKWAVPGRTYGQKVQTIHEAILTGK
ncbi:mannosyl-glycoprotein endo-beta-N-acetylglucosamidase [Anaerosporomusa subterranea]|uniref:Mannosyl-glycoprotein endo-beta-N-acetylglucosamidase n=1 Tax=Anaerosporomusa subterranea TaxID=1794912 RepID=A0A154BW82_ANASB|nr:glucosaminidase domain-containing protein [Anaerosporomusa subterranea]KYZ78135.1 mannosyl-glycoprotein endo-beta-N-acetylglucosamidase [Anaerosporomusa subterranea]